MAQHREVEPFEQKVEVERGIAIWRPQFVGQMLSIKPIPTEVRVGHVIQNAATRIESFAPGTMVTILGADGEYTIRGRRVKQ